MSRPDHPWTLAPGDIPRRGGGGPKKVAPAWSCREGDAKWTPLTVAPSGAWSDPSRWFKTDDDTWIRKGGAT